MRREHFLILYHYERSQKNWGILPQTPDWVTVASPKPPPKLLFGFLLSNTNWKKEGDRL
ncbi:hypothetical protein FDUTEX481_07476 [Tolypothrix sp. PCC 7601]|nr:hypothetical protein FDUTEX481_07476 [Tolypothrix sp. PCC 7601]